MSSSCSVFTEEEKDFIRNNYGKLSYGDIAKALGKSATQVKTWRKAHLKSKFGIGNNPFSRSSVKYKCNENYFSSLTFESAYWAGFIAADGYINKRINLLRIMLQGSDESHLKKFKNSLHAESKIFKGETRRNFNNKGIKTYYHCYISITSKKIVADLELLYNIVQSKSLKYQPPKWLSEDMSLWFIKGYIDGDGSISRPVGDKWDARLQIVGTFELVTWVRQVFENILGFNLTAKTIYKRNSIYVLIVTNKNAINILKVLSKIPISLDRKWEDVEFLCDNYTHPRRLLSEKQISEIMLKLKDKIPQHVIAKEYGVSQMLISYCNQGKIKPKNAIN